jgi:hypothetical protein
MLTLLDAPPYDAVRDPLWFVVRVPALIVNDAVAALAGTITDDGTVRRESPVLRLTIAPPDPAGFDSVTMQSPLTFDPKVDGLHCKEEMALPGATKDTVEETDPPLYAAVTVAF